MATYSVFWILPCCMYALAYALCEPEGTEIVWKTALSHCSCFLNFSSLIFKHSRDTTYFSHLKFSLNDLIIFSPNQKALTSDFFLNFKGNSDAEESLGAVILGIKAKCGINVPSTMGRTLNDILWGVIYYD